MQKSWKKFLRRNYIKERIKGCLYVIEAKNIGKGWNIHIHAIIYGRRLDNQVRGKCMDCGQNLLKYDDNKQQFCCANHRCNSFNVTSNGDSKLVKLFKKCSGRDVNIHISNCNSAESALNYLLKYISSNKEDFSSPKDIADFIFHTRNKRLVNTQGIFFNMKTNPINYLCYKCSSLVTYTFDIELSRSITEEQEKEQEKRAKRPPDIRDYLSENQKESTPDNLSKV